MSSWCFVSEDKINGRNQKGVSLWARVHAVYHEAQAENSEEICERNIDSMKGSWKRFAENENKWLAAYKEAYGRKRSGMSPTDVEKEAHSIYEAGGSKFQDLVVFNEVMSKHPKWELTFDSDSTRFLSENEMVMKKVVAAQKDQGLAKMGIILSLPTQKLQLLVVQLCLILQGEIRQKRRKDKTSQSSSTNEVAAKIRALRLTRDNEAKLIRARLDLEREKLQRNSMKMKEVILNTLLAKDHLSPKDEEMKRRLMAIVFWP